MATQAMADASNLLSVCTQLRHQVVSYALRQVAFGYMQLLSGAIMVCLTILRWNTAERDALICKLLRGKLQELEPGAAPNGGPAASIDNMNAPGGPSSVS